MVFVELTPFVHFREEHWTDEDFGALQRFLIVTPTAGDVIRGTHGLRKLRWTARGRGKRGGARVIYYWQASRSRVYLWVSEERERGPDSPAAESRSLIDEGHCRWISNTSIN